jgi:hypothetical protein
MKVLLALVLAANGVAWAVAQVLGGGGNVSGASLTVITDSLQMRQGRLTDPTLTPSRRKRPANTPWRRVAL